jgi:hypothetical protein
MRAISKTVASPIRQVEQTLEWEEDQLDLPKSKTGARKKIPENATVEE